MLVQANSAVRIFSGLMLCQATVFGCGDQIHLTPLPAIGTCSDPAGKCEAQVGGAGGREWSGGGTGGPTQSRPRPSDEADAGGGAGTTASATTFTPPGDAGAAPRCGDGVVDPGELCDGDCPSSCDDKNPCTVDLMKGNAARCSVLCSHESILETNAGDGCCPVGATAQADSDCSPTCGDGTTNGNELCDGDCPTTCDDGDPCTADRLSGAAAKCNVACSHQTITASKSGDACCPAGANARTDADCSAVCGNGVREGDELCDGTDCPSDCDDGDPCTADKLTGSADSCTATCSSQPVTAMKSGDGCCPAGANARSDADCSPTCGDGVRNGNELCDGTDCPSDCDDGDPCTQDRVVGAAAQCNAACTNRPITAPRGGDGCCPAGANARNDADCVAVCGNGVLENQELCDGDCPTSCDDGDSCTADKLTGSAERCTAACMSSPITAARSGDGCCPAGATARNDLDCAPACGDGVRNGNETCDGDCPTSCDDGDPCTVDKLVGSASQCTAACANTSKPASGQVKDGCCTGGVTDAQDADCVSVSPVAPLCGNGVIDLGELCDDSLPKSACPKNSADCERARGAACWHWMVEGEGCQRRCVRGSGICQTVPSVDGELVCRNDCPADMPLDPWR